MYNTYVKPHAIPYAGHTQAEVFRKWHCQQIKKSLIKPSSAGVFKYLAGLPLYEILQFQCTTNSGYELHNVTNNAVYGQTNVAVLFMFVILIVGVFA